MSRIRTICQLLPSVAYHFVRSKVDRKHRLKYSDEFVQTQAVVGPSVYSEDELADLLLGMGDMTGREPEELAEACYYLTSSGVGDNLSLYLHHAIVLSDVAGCPLEVAADILTDLAAFYQVDIDRLDRVTAAIQLIVDETPLTASEGASILQRVDVVVARSDTGIVDVAWDVVDAYPVDRTIDHDTAIQTTKERVREQHTR
jgi:hypothetical protein